MTEQEAFTFINTVWKYLVKPNCEKDMTDDDWKNLISNTEEVVKIFKANPMVKQIALALWDDLDQKERNKQK